MTEGLTLSLFTFSQMTLIAFVFTDDSVDKEPSFSAGDTGDVGSNPGPGRFPGDGNGNPFQHSCLGSPMNRRASKGSQRVGHD